MPVRRYEGELWAFDFADRPGLRLNLSRSGASVSLGRRGFHYTISPKGSRVTVGLPGSGLSSKSFSTVPIGRGQPVTGTARQGGARTTLPGLGWYITKLQRAGPIFVRCTSFLCIASGSAGIGPQHLLPLQAKNFPLDCELSHN
jgi:hypothetical protein